MLHMPSSELIPSTMLGRKSVWLFFILEWHIHFQQEILNSVLQLLQGVSSSFLVVDSIVLDYKNIAEKTATLI